MKGLENAQGVNARVISANAWQNLPISVQNTWKLKAKEIKIKTIKSNEGIQYLIQHCKNELENIGDVR